MAAKAEGARERSVEELFFQNEAFSLCMLVNRRARTVRVVDFRAGPSKAKQLFVLSFAQRGGLQKVFTLVERDEVLTWVKMGFAKEGNIPGFYKRSDAFLLGCAASTASLPREGDEVPTQSETRIVAAKPTAGPTPITPAQEKMERTILTAKKWIKDAPDRVLSHAKVSIVSEAVARKAVNTSLRNGRAITAFEPFGRDVARRYFVIAVRGGFELNVSTETQACFSNAYVEVLQGPRTESERLPTASALSALCEALRSEGVVSCFSLAPSDDTALAAAFLQNGFRRTGLLADHLLLGTVRKDAIVWSRKLGNPNDE